MENWQQFDGWCTSRGIDTITLAPDRACNTYLWAVRENADEKQLKAIDAALEPPKAYRHQGAPAWYGSDEDAWAQFEAEARRARR